MDIVSSEHNTTLSPREKAILQVKELKSSEDIIASKLATLLENTFEENKGAMCFIESHKIASIILNDPDLSNDADVYYWMLNKNPSSASSSELDLKHSAIIYIKDEKIYFIDSVGFVSANIDPGIYKKENDWLSTKEVSDRYNVKYTQLVSNKLELDDSGKIYSTINIVNTHPLNTLNG